jgi:ABC-type transport system involved in cytochrome c biogenesis permease subunit
MDFKQLNGQINQEIAKLNQELTALVNFVTYKLKNFPNLTIGEQISYPAIGLGFILILVGIVLLIL